MATVKIGKWEGWIGFVTPKAYVQFEGKIEELKKLGVEIQPTTAIYMNLLDPEWTTEKCDTMLYLVEKDSFIKNVSFLRESGE